MNGEIIVAIIGLVGAIIVALISYAGTKAGAKKANAESNALFAYRLDKLEEKMDRHNQFMERFQVVEAFVDDLRKERKK